MTVCWKQERKISSLKVSSRQESIYQGLYAVTGLISVITVSLGYRLAYLLAVGQGLLCTVVALQD